MLKDIHIRQANLKDIEEIAVLFNHYRMFYDQPSNVQAAKKFMKERLEYEDSIIYIAVYKGRAVGLMQLYPTFSSISVKRAYILNDLYVVEEARGKGIGQQLMEKAIQFSKDKDASYITLTTAVTNTTAKRLYERNGFKKETEFDTYNYSFI
ncbi:GNAT family N-acetyltransferase [Heyndrickxia ginsengihumi]|uniref:GNAT family N-acetyltransferase n=1 Tax=Heyndrickxia ginsengihumi TaxID=363870 RepID=UPI000A746F37|nr:GNAT family N-acetyltransferase [Heyndrickxia ginsengihumi]